MLRENVEDCRWEKDLGGFEGDLRLFGGESEGELSVNQKGEGEVGDVVQGLRDQRGNGKCGVQDFFQ